MTDDEILALRRFRAEQVASNEDSIVALADEALRRGEELADFTADNRALREQLGQQGQQLRERIARLEAALEKSVMLQSHYAFLLNEYDDGDRLQFADAAAWMKRLDELAEKKP